MTKKYYHAIDIARVVAAFVVVAVHTNPLQDYTEVGDYFINTVIGRLVVPFFFIVSGYFFGRKLVFDKPVSSDISHLFAFLKKIFMIYVVWTLIYLPFQFIEWLHSDDSWEYWFTYAHEVIMKGSYYPLWYLTGLLVATAVSYMLFKMMKPALVLVITGGLFLIGTAMNSYYDILQLDGLFQTYYELFLTTRNGLFFGSFYVSLGILLSKRSRTLPFRLNLLFFFISLTLMTIEVFSLRQFEFSRGIDMWFMAVPTTYFLFAFLKQMDIKDRAFFAYFRPLSLLMYVSHGLFMIRFKDLLEVNSILYFAVVLVGTVLLSVLIIFMSKRWKRLRMLY